MKTPDELLNKHAKIHMKQWDLKQFKLKYPSLYKVFVDAINEASGNEPIKDIGKRFDEKFGLFLEYGIAGRKDYEECKQACIDNPEHFIKYLR